MRLIDADAAVKDARLNYGDVHDAVLMEQFLRSQPTVTLVIRCKDCTHYGDVGDCEVHPHDGRFNREYFCADGERRKLDLFGEGKVEEISESGRNDR